MSTLFRGHPSLIQGFNTFLPAGYRIDCSTDALHADFITVTTPTGTHTQAIRASFAPLPPPPHERDFVGSVYDPTLPRLRTVEPDIELALSYVQKVKNRYMNDPDRYKAFLEILSPGDNRLASSLNDVSGMS